MQPTPLFARLSYLVANAITVLPQGTETIFAQNACVVTWQLAQYAATFPQALAAGMPLPALWGSFASNIAPNLQKYVPVITQDPASGNARRGSTIVINGPE